MYTIQFPEQQTSIVQFIPDVKKETATAPASFQHMMYRQQSNILTLKLKQIYQSKENMNKIKKVHDMGRGYTNTLGFTVNPSIRHCVFQKILKTCFSQPNIIVLMKEMLYNISQNVENHFSHQNSGSIGKI